MAPLLSGSGVPPWVDCDAGGAGPRQRMRILHVTPYYAPAWAWGGVVAAVSGLARAQQRAGHHVQVLTTDTLGPWTRGQAGTTTLDGVPVWRTRTRSLALRARLNLSWPRGFFAAAYRLIEHDGVEVVHCHELRTVETIAASRAAARKGAPVVLSPHGTLSYETGRKELKRVFDALLARRFFGRFAHVVALTSCEADEVRKLWASLGVPIHGGQVSIVPHGVDPGPAVEAPERRAARDRLGLLTEDRVVLFMGRLHERKRIPLLIEAFALFAGRCRNARLILAGPDAGALTAVRAAVLRPRAVLEAAEAT